MLWLITLAWCILISFLAGEKLYKRLKAYVEVTQSTYDSEEINPLLQIFSRPHLLPLISVVLAMIVYIGVGWIWGLILAVFISSTFRTLARSKKYLRIEAVDSAQTDNISSE